MIALRHSRLSDVAALETLYVSAFPEEDLRPLLRCLLGDRACAQSLVAEEDNEIGGHIAFTRCGLPGVTIWIALLGPLCVAPDRQGQGIGSTLVRVGLQRIAAAGAAHAVVLGDPGYYRRFGFTAEQAIAPPYDLPKDWSDAWQGLPLTEVTLPAGQLDVPGVWRSRALWG